MIGDKFLHEMILIPVSYSTLSFHNGEMETQGGGKDQSQVSVRAGRQESNLLCLFL